MLRTRTITKAGVIQALKRERLVGGSFFRVAGTGGVEPVGCEVCAVGAVLRRYSFEKTAREKGLDLHQLGMRATLYKFFMKDVEELLEQKNYLGALSCVFEAADGNKREAAIDFVKKRFPTRFNLTVDMRG